MTGLPLDDDLGYDLGFSTPDSPSEALPEDQVYDEPVLAQKTEEQLLEDNQALAQLLNERRRLLRYIEDECIEDERQKFDYRERQERLNEQWAVITENGVTFEEAVQARTNELKCEYFEIIRNNFRRAFMLDTEETSHEDRADTPQTTFKVENNANYCSPVILLKDCSASYQDIIKSFTEDFKDDVVTCDRDHNPEAKSNTLPHNRRSMRTSKSEMKARDDVVDIPPVKSHTVTNTIAQKRKHTQIANKRAKRTSCRSNNVVAKTLISTSEISVNGKTSLPDGSHRPRRSRSVVNYKEKSLVTYVHESQSSNISDLHLGNFGVHNSATNSVNLY